MDMLGLEASPLIFETRSYDVSCSSIRVSILQMLLILTPSSEALKLVHSDPFIDCQYSLFEVL